MTGVGRFQLKKTWALKIAGLLRFYISFSTPPQAREKSLGTRLDLTENNRCMLLPGARNMSVGSIPTQC